MPTWGRSTLTGTDERNHTSGNVIMVRGTFPATTAAKLDSVSIHAYRGDGSTINVRVAVYQGGTSNTDITNATLVEDLGILTWTGTTFATRTKAALGTSNITASTRTWIVLKHASSGYTLLDTTTVGSELTAGFAVQAAGGISTDQTVAFPSTYPSATIGTDVEDLAIWLSYTDSGGGSSAPRSQFYHLHGMR